MPNAQSPEWCCYRSIDRPLHHFKRTCYSSHPIKPSSSRLLSSFFFFNLSLPPIFCSENLTYAMSHTATYIRPPFLFLNFRKFQLCFCFFVFLFIFPAFGGFVFFRPLFLIASFFIPVKFIVGKERTNQCLFICQYIYIRIEHERNKERKEKLRPLLLLKVKFHFGVSLFQLLWFLKFCPYVG